MFPAMQHVLICSTLPVLCFVGLDEPNESLGSSRHTKPKQLVEMVCILNVTVFHVRSIKLYTYLIDDGSLVSDGRGKKYSHLDSQWPIMVHPYALPPRRAHPAPLNCTPVVGI